ncbi:hypothetical protein EVA_12169 [gut metagenome]|uniref:Uncharacterized protein n=1 Tax=gut metagenome TaxID=749906 RepID=J9FXL6_9ZZZZ
MKPTIIPLGFTYFTNLDGETNPQHIPLPKYNGSDFTAKHG